MRGDVTDSGIMRVLSKICDIVYSSCCNADQGIYYYKTYENSALTAVSLFREDLEGRVPVSYALETELRVRWSN